MSTRKHVKRASIWLALSLFTLAAGCECDEHEPWTRDVVMVLVLQDDIAPATTPSWWPELRQELEGADGLQNARLLTTVQGDARQTVVSVWEHRGQASSALQAAGVQEALRAHGGVVGIYALNDRQGDIRQATEATHVVLAEIRYRERADLEVDYEESSWLASQPGYAGSVLLERIDDGTGAPFLVVYRWENLDAITAIAASPDLNSHVTFQGDVQLRFYAERW